MKNSENRKFEESWKNAFSDAEINPSQEVWDGIDLRLSKFESGNMKRRVVFYQRLAAASVLFALLAGGAGIWWATKGGRQLETVANGGSQSVSTEPLVKSSAKEEMKNSINSTNSSDLSEGMTTPKNELSSLQDVVNRKKNTGNYLTPKDEGNHYPLARNWQASLGVDDERNRLATRRNDDNKRTLSTGEFPTISSEELPEIGIRLSGEPIRMVAQAKHFKELSKPSKDEQKNDRGWWASVGGAAGNYNPNTSSSTSFSQAQFTGLPTTSRTTAPSSSESSTGTAFSYGVNLGKKVSKRWVIVTGLNYLNQSIGYNSNVASLDANNRAQAFVADLSANAANLTTIAPYRINSSNEFLSIPLQAGFIVLNKKIGLQLNAGVASDFFMKNTLMDEGGRLASYSVGAGDNSTFRSINWTGLASTELSYRISDHYLLSLLPGVRYGLNPVLKSGTTLPIIWDVGFRFRYIF